MARTVGDQAAAEAEQMIAALAEGHCPLHPGTRLERPDPAWGGWCPNCYVRWRSDDRTVDVTELTPVGAYGHSWSVDQVRDMLAPRLILADTVSQIRASAAR